MVGSVLFPAAMCCPHCGWDKAHFRVPMTPKNKQGDPLGRSYCGKQRSSRTSTQVHVEQGASCSLVVTMLSCCHYALTPLVAPPLTSLLTSLITQRDKNRTPGTPRPLVSLINKPYRAATKFDFHISKSILVNNCFTIPALPVQVSVAKLTDLEREALSI